MIKNKLSLALLCTAVLFIGSCADENITDDNHGNKGGMSFEVSDVQDAPEDNPQSRSIAAAEPIGSIPFNESIAADACLQETTIDGVNPVKRTPETRAFLKSTIDADFGVSASKNGSNQADYFYNERVSNTGVMVNPKVWSTDASSLKFYAIYPYMDGSNPNQKLVQASANALPTVDFTASTDIANQTDLMSAVTNEISYTPSSGGAAHVVPLKFRHALTAIRFGVGSNLSWGKTIKSVEFQNIHNKGNYNPATHTWTTGSTTANFKLDNINVLTNGTLNNVILKDGNTFLMVPQTLPSGAKIVITFNDGTSITAKIEGGKWKPGTTKTYMMTEKNSNWEYIIQATSPSAVGYNISQTGAYGIISYRKVGTTFQPVKWRVVKYQESTDGGLTWGPESDTKPTWLTALSKENGDGGTIAETGTASIKTSIVDLLDERNAKLKINPKGRIGEYYDLSTHDIKGNPTSRNTANCYVISHPGYYKLPLVYGNAIKDGNKNESSYKTTNTGTFILQNFKDHMEQNITDPWIEKTNGGANNGIDNAKVVWADESNLVSNLAIEHDVLGDGYLQFEVKAENIRGGNVVVAAMRGSTIVWSWHLWFAPDNVLDKIEVTNFQGVKYYFASETIGWRYTSWKETNYKQPRKIKVQIEQLTRNSGTVQKAEFTITQNPATIVKNGNSTLYQWGRKDALPGVTSVSEGSFNENAGGNMSIQNGIQHPENFYTYSPSWYNTPPLGYSYINLWSMRNITISLNDNPVIKTIYDPSPAGFNVPASNAFTAFTTTGEDRGPINTIGWNGGWVLNNKITNPNATIYIPPTGFRSNTNGGLHNVMLSCNCWTAIPSSLHHAYNMVYGPSYLEPKNREIRAYGRAVHPVAEQSNP